MCRVLLRATAAMSGIRWPAFSRGGGGLQCLYFPKRLLQGGRGKSARIDRGRTLYGRTGAKKRGTSLLEEYTVEMNKRRTF